VGESVGRSGNSNRGTCCSAFELREYCLDISWPHLIGASNIRLDFAADALESYQRIVTLSLASMGGEELPRREPTRGVDRSRLFIRDLTRDQWASFWKRSLPITTRRSMEALIAKFGGGEYDGWEAEVRPDATLN
jgi:hypothetical protein